MSRFSEVMIPRAQWGARAPKSVDTTFTKVGGVVIHHSAVRRAGTVHYPGCYQSVKNHQNYHMDNRGWNDIAYNFVVCQHGFIFEGRGFVNQNGANTPLNTATLSVCFDGDTRYEEVGAAALLSIKAVVEEARLRGWADLTRGHGQATGTSSCPGTKLQAIIDSGAFAAPAPVPPAPAPTPEPVPQPSEPAPTGYSLTGLPQATVRQMQEWARSKGATTTFVTLAPIFYREATALSVRPEFVYALSAHETAFGRFGGVIDESFHNWGGLKTPSGGGNFDPDAHARFPDDVVGVRAVVQHVALYAGVDVPVREIVDPRWNRSILGAAPTLPSNGWQWSSSPAAHAEKILGFVAAIEGVS